MNDSIVDSAQKSKAVVELNFLNESFDGGSSKTIPVEKKPEVPKQKQGPILATRKRQADVEVCYVVNKSF